MAARGPTAARGNAPGGHSDLLQAWLRFGAHRLHLYAALATDSIAPDARRHGDAAQQAYGRILAWARRELAPPFRQNVAVLRFAMWEIRLRRVPRTR